MLLRYSGFKFIVVLSILISLVAVTIISSILLTLDVTGITNPPAVSVNQETAIGFQTPPPLEATLSGFKSSTPDIHKLVEIYGSRVAAVGAFTINEISGSLAVFSTTTGKWGLVENSPKITLTDAAVSIDGIVYTSGESSLYSWSPSTNEIIELDSPGYIQDLVISPTGELIASTQTPTRVSSYNAITSQWITLSENTLAEKLLYDSTGSLYATNSALGVLKLDPTSNTFNSISDTLADPVSEEGSLPLLSTVTGATAISLSPTGELYATIKTIDGQFLATFNSTIWVKIPGLPTGVISTLTFTPNNKLVIGGSFGAPENNIILYNVNTNTWDPLNAPNKDYSGVNGPVISIVSIGATITIAGNFSEAGGIPTNNVISYLTEKIVWSPLTVDSAARDGADITISGLNMNNVVAVLVAERKALLVARSSTDLKLALPAYTIPVELGFDLGPIVGPALHAQQKGPVFYYHAPGRPRVLATYSGTTVELSWEDAPGVSTYTVIVDGKTTNLVSNQLKLSGLAPGHLFNFSVAACDSIGCGDSYDDTIALLPAIPKPTISLLSENTTIIGWDSVVGADYYKVKDGAGDLISIYNNEFSAGKSDSQRNYSFSACSQQDICSYYSYPVAVATSRNSLDPALRSPAPTREATPVPERAVGSPRAAKEFKESNDSLGSGSILLVLILFLTAGATIGALTTLVGPLRARLKKSDSNTYN